MRKIVLACLVALSVAGCSWDEFVTGTKAVFTASTATVSNPVTPTMLYDLENGMTIAFAGLGVYKRSCVAGAIPSSCRGTIQRIQVYTRRIPTLLAQLRGFVRNNDQVNASVVYNTVMGLITAYKAEASAANIQVQ